MLRKFAIRSALRASLRMIVWTSLIGAPLSSGCGAPSNEPDSPRATRPDPTVIAEGRHWARMFYERDTEALWNQFTPQVQSSMKSKEGLDDFRQTFEGRMGTETQLFDERVLRRSLLEIYVRPATFEYSGTRQAMLIGFDEPGKIDLFAIDVLEPPREAPSSHLEYVPRTPLRLPFDGAWYVLWGGRTIVQNRHAAVRDQRFAYDFIVVQDDKSYRTNGHENADYLCFGQPVLAPGAGTIVTVVDGIEDNVPRAMNAGSLGSGILGNHVVIAHGPNEFSFLAHFKNGSTRVQVGAQVEAGDPIGLCGNSGSSTEPHLHYHLQNTAAYAHGDGLPAHFRNYTSNGRFVESGEPIREERIVNGRN